MISKKEALALYRKIFLSRRSEEKIRELYPQDEIKSPVHLGIGQEAIPLGVVQALPKKTKYFGTYRNHILYLALSNDTDGFFAELYGKEAGIAKGKGGSMHLMAPHHGLMMTSAVVGTTIPLAVGAAFAHVYHKTNEPAVAFFGDGAMEEGVFWESLNFACLKKLPVLFVCEDNDLAIHSPAKERQGFRSIPDAVAGFDCYQISADGTDLLKVIDQTKKVFSMMKKKRKPAFLHFTYFRFLEHVGIHEDFPSGYRKKPSAAEMKKKDPVEKFRANLIALKCSSKEIQSVEQEVEGQIEQSVQKARKAPFPSPEELHKDVFA